jgi:hypothetical protein
LCTSLAAEFARLRPDALAPLLVEDLFQNCFDGGSDPIPDR